MDCIKINCLRRENWIAWPLQIYLSEYGKQRLQQEEVEGPPELVAKDEDVEKSEIDTEEGEQLKVKQLTRVQLVDNTQ